MAGERFHFTETLGKYNTRAAAYDVSTCMRFLLSLFLRHWFIVHFSSVAITLQGSDWLLYNVYDADVTSSYHYWKSISFVFKVYDQMIGFQPISRPAMPTVVMSGSLRAIRSESLVWLIGAVLCLLSANCRSSCSLMRTMDGRIVRCGKH